MIDCESVLQRGDENKRLALEVLTLAALLSSHLVLVSTSPLNQSALSEVEMLGEISSLIQIKKNQDSRGNLYNYLPTLTWLVTGSELQETDK